MTKTSDLKMRLKRSRESIRTSKTVRNKNNNNNNLEARQLTLGCSSCATVISSTLISSSILLPILLLTLTLNLQLALADHHQQLVPSFSHQHHHSHGSNAQINNNNNINNDNQMMAGSAPASSFIKDISGPVSGKIQTLDVICGKNFMTVRAEFSGPFYGIVFSKGTYGQENCIYVKPNSGLTHAAFNVYYDQCGTKPDLQGKFYENTVVIQYGSDIIEAYDEAKRLRCEWFEAYEKPATFKPAIPVADLEVVEMNFQGDDIDCWMEIQEGTGPMAHEVSKIVPVGQPMTIVVAINDYNGQFDMRVKSCVAHDGVQQPIALTDEFGCVLRPKMLTPFKKLRNPGGIHKKATILSYSRFLAFKFPDSMTVQIQCTVEVCRHGCADACQRVPSIAATTMQPELSLTAKWPSAPNQPALAAATDQQVARQQPAERYLPPPQQQQQQQTAGNTGRIQLGGRPATTMADDQPMFRPQQPPQAMYQPPVGDHNMGASPTSGSPSDDMNGSESNQQPTIQQVQQQQQQQPQSPAGPVNQQRRSQDHQMDLNRVPQYLMAQQRRQFPLHGARIPQISTTASAGPSAQSSTSTTTTTTTYAPTTTSFATTVAVSTEQPLTSSEQPVNRASSSEDDNQPAADQSADDSITRNEQPSRQDPSVESASDQSDGDAASDAIKPEGSNPKPQVVVAAGDGSSSSSSSSDEAPQNQADKSGDQSATNEQPAAGDSNKPSVQGSDDELAKPADNSEATAAASSPSSGSSLKTVEVEIPAAEQDTLLAAASASAGNGRPGSSFQSVRLSNVDLSQSNGGSVSFEPNSYGSASVSASRPDEQASIIQPRDQQQQQSQPSLVSDNQRNQDQEDNFESQLMSAGKIRFGARSQPQQAAVAPSSSPSQAGSTHSLDQQSSATINRHSNHQMSSSASGPDSGGSSSSEISTLVSSGGDSASLDKAMIDRADDSSSSLTGAGESIQSVSPDRRSDLMADVSDMAAEESVVSSGKIKPVVGTDELATGPIQIEDRIGQQGQQQQQHQESLEEALNRLQHQIPQAAALVSSNSQQQQQQQASLISSSGSGQLVANSSSADGQRSIASQDHQQQQQQQVFSSLAAAKVDPNVANDRSDSSSSGQAPRHHQEMGNSQKLASLGPQVVLQPHPNVVGQAKVLPDPSGVVNSRGSMLTQSSNQEGAKQVIQAPTAPINNGLGQALNPQQQQQQQLQQQQPLKPQQASPLAEPKPVAQITNVPISLGFPPSQIPAIQQLSQQLAQFQQQQQQSKQQQQQQSTTTSKPALRSRFNLLNPQAAIQAVASRFLPKSTSSAAATNGNTNQQQQHIARLPMAAQLPQILNSIKSMTPEQQQQFLANSLAVSQQQQQQQQQAAFPFKQQIPTQQYYNMAGNHHQQQQQQQQAPSGGLFNRLSGLPSQQQQPLVRTRRSAIMPNGKRGNGEVGMTKTFMVVTGMDLAFSPNNLNETELPQILEGRRLVDDEGDVVYGVCMPIISLTFVLTCAFWLIVFLLGFCIYLLIKSRRQSSIVSSNKLMSDN